MTTPNWGRNLRSLLVWCVVDVDTSEHREDAGGLIHFKQIVIITVDDPVGQQSILS